MVSRQQVVNVPYVIMLKGQAHVDLANLRDDIAAVRHFVRRWMPERIDIPIERKAQVDLFLNFRDSLRAGWHGKPHDLLFEDFGPEECRTVDGLEYHAKDIWSGIPLLFLRDRKRLAICTNDSCPNPYFVRRRRTQKYCEAGPCVAEAQRAQKRDWWMRNRGKGSYKTSGRDK